MTAAKYIPQAYSHWRRHSTKGFSIDQVLLDLTGGIFSLAQLMIDSYDVDFGMEFMFNAMAQNPGKLGLAAVSMAFDAVFISQHYILYGPVDGVMSDADVDDDSSATDVEADDGERQPLLRARDL